MLGGVEQSWLATKLRTSTARWKLVGQGVMFAPLKVQAASNANKADPALKTPEILNRR